MQHDILEILKNRRSVRKFKEEKLEKETIRQILKAALLAPSSKNKKPAEFIVVEDKETIQKLKVCKNFGTEGLNTAPCAIAVIADGQKSDVWIEDASAAAILMQVEAESLGVGSVWIQIRNRQSGPESSEEEVRKVLHIPEKYCVLCVLAMGYKDEDKEPYEEENLDFSKIHNGRY